MMMMMMMMMISQLRNSQQDWQLGNKRSNLRHNRKSRRRWLWRRKTAIPKQAMWAWPIPRKLHTANTLMASWNQSLLRLKLWKGTLTWPVTPLLHEEALQAIQLWPRHLSWFLQVCQLVPPLLHWPSWLCPLQRLPLKSLQHSTHYSVPTNILQAKSSRRTTSTANLKFSSLPQTSQQLQSMQNWSRSQPFFMTLTPLLLTANTTQIKTSIYATHHLMKTSQAGSPSSRFFTLPWNQILSRMTCGCKLG